MSAPASPTVESAPAAVTTTAQPAAVQRSLVDDKDNSGTLSSREARDFLKNKRAERTKLKLRLASDDGETVTHSDEPADAPEAVTPEQGADDGSSETDKPPEVEPTWAQKLRTDLSKKTERVAELEKAHAAREQKFSEAHRAVTHRIEDMAADVKAEQAYSTMLEEAIASAGMVVPADWKRAALAERKAERLERHLARGQTQQRSQGHEKSAEAAREQVAALGKQIPEIAAGVSGKDPEVQAWLRERFAIDDKGRPVGLGMKNLDKDALAFAKALRWDRHSRAKAAAKGKATPKPGESERPTSTTLTGSNGNAGARRAPMVPKNEKETIAWLAARRAARK
jgi:hypothetical protein